jgi:hypothetical protein
MQQPQLCWRRASPEFGRKHVCGLMADTPGTLTVRSKGLLSTRGAFTAASMGSAASAPLNTVRTQQKAGQEQ